MGPHWTILAHSFRHSSTGSGHQIHISLPINRLLISGVDPAVIPWPQDLLTAHHFYLGIAFITSGVISVLFLDRPTQLSSSQSSQLEGLGWYLGQRGGVVHSSHAQLSVNLLFVGLSSMLFGFVLNSVPVYPYQAIDYPTSTAMFCHHINIGTFLIVGAFAHASIFMIRDFSTSTPSTRSQGFSFSLPSRSLVVGIHKNPVLNHRCLVIGHLIYLSIALGLHSFGLYIHNDTLQSLGRAEDMFSDNSIQFKPLIPSLANLSLGAFDIEVLDGKVLSMTQELGTADFMLHHIHAFTIHVTLLVLLKGILYARGSRLNSDKLELGFRYPCDGPGRGGTCQISPYDHLYLALFWSYNFLSVVLFHYFWKMQSDVWASLWEGHQGNMKEAPLPLRHHISGSDFSVNSGTINGWLRNFLWSQAAQVIQSYATSIFPICPAELSI
jgi:photosystem I P700 chlorophyll a apoprotein A1